MEINFYVKRKYFHFLKSLSSAILFLSAWLSCIQVSGQYTPGLVSCGYAFSGEQVCNNGEFSCCSFTTISGGTTLATSSGMTNANYTIDLSSLSPAFNFDFNGVTYNTFGVNTNGFVWLGATAPLATTTQPIALTGAVGTTPDGIISAWGAALEGSASGTLSYVVSGTSPNRILTIQWAKVRLVDFSAAMPGFQIILYENGGTNSNLIEFLYGDMNCDFISSNAADNIQIGLRGTSNADFNDLTGSGGNGFGWTAGGNNVAGQVTTSAGTANTSGLKWHTEPFIWGNNEITYTPTINTPGITQGGPNTWCSGSGGSELLTAVSTLPASPAAYQWQTYTYPPANTDITGQTSSTYSANPDTSGIILYVVQVTNGAGCSRTSPADTITVTSCAGACSPPVASSNGALCVGDTLKLSASSIANVTYGWTGPNGFSSGSQDTIITNITLADTGNYSVVATYDTCSSSPAVVHVVINPIPSAPVASNTGPFCAGGTLQLNASLIPNATYNWTGPNNFTNQQNPTKSNLALSDAGTYSVIAIVSGCSSTAATTDVIINTIPSAPTASNTGPYCAGGTLQLNATAITNATYNWTGPNNFSNQQNPGKSNITTSDAGTYSVVATVSGCNSTAATTSVVINPIPSAPTATNTGPYCAGGTLQLNASNLVNATYNWTGPNNFSNQQNPTKSNITLSDSGIYSVIVTVSGCSSTAATTDVVINAIPSGPTASNTGPYCAGGTLQLNASTITNATYNWTGPNNFTGQQNPTKSNITSADAGTYSVIATVSGCSSTAATTDVVINAIPTTPTASNTGPYCVGGALQLNASTANAATYNWTGPNNFTNQQNPTKSNITSADAGTYSVVATVSGCSSTAATTDVVINPIPSAPTVSNTGPYCIGGTLQLNASTIANASYNWTGPNNFSSQQNPTKSNITFADAGTYSVIATVSGCSSTAATTTVVINSIPSAPTASNTGPYCAGGTLQLNASMIANATYNWTGPNNFTSQQNPTKTNITTSDAGTYSVVATVNGCNSTAATTSVVVNPIPPAPTAGNTGPYCAGGTLQLNASTINGATYNWTGPNNFSDQQNPSKSNVTTSDAGIYSVVVIVNGCSSSAAITIVVINTIPSTLTASNTGPYCAGGTLQLNASTVNGATYNWTGPNNFPNQQNPGKSNLTTSDAGTYSVVATVNGCNSAPATTSVVVNPTPATPTASNTGPYCTGDTLQLIAALISGATYNWTGPNNFTNQQDPVKANVAIGDSGTYSVTVVVNGCSSATSVTHVMISLPPSAPSLSSNSPVCQGDTLKLSAGSILGAIYNWTGPVSFNSQQNPSIANATFADSGIFTVITTVGPCNSPPASIDISISPTPVLSGLTSNSPVCTGDTLKLNVMSSAGSVYTWTGPGNFSSNLQNPNIANSIIADSGLYTVTAALGNCTSASGGTYVIVNTTPAPPTLTTSRDTICSSDSARICAPDGFINYLWSTGADSVSCTYATSAGDFWVTVTASNGCTTISDHLSISVYPVSSVAIIVLGDTLSALNGSAYQWIFDDTILAGDTSNIYVAGRPGTYAVEVTDANGCLAISSPVTIVPTDLTTVSGLGQLEIYPNPSSTGNLEIRAGQQYIDHYLEIFDDEGKAVYRSKMVNPVQQMDISQLANGVYILRVSDNIRKFIKE